MEIVQNPELMAVVYEVGGSVVPGLKGHIPLSAHTNTHPTEYNGLWKESVTNGPSVSEPRLCVYIPEAVSLWDLKTESKAFHAKIIFKPHDISENMDLLTMKYTIKNLVTILTPLALEVMICAIITPALAIICQFHYITNLKRHKYE